MNRLPGRGQRAADHIVNTFRLHVDACDRLWAVDMAAANGTSYGDPQLLVIDLRTDRVVRRFAVTADLRRADGTTWFPGLLVDVDAARCGDAHAYLPDIGWGLVVYSYRRDAAWRLDHHYFHFDPVATVFDIGGVRLEWPDGVFGLALSPGGTGGDRTLYFHALASTRMFAVNTAALKANRTDAFYEYRHLGHRSAGMQAGAMASDPATGVLFYALVNRDAVGCWNPGRVARMSDGTSAVVASDPVTMVFPADVKVDRASNLWVISDRMPLHRFRVRDFDVTDVNYRVFSAPVADVVRGTVCEPEQLPGAGRPEQQGGEGPAQQGGSRPTQQGGGRPEQQGGGRPTQQGGGRPTQQGGGRPTQQGGGRPTQQGGGRPTQQGGGRPTQQGGDGDGDGDNGNEDGDGSDRPVWSRPTQQQSNTDRINGPAWNTPNQRGDFDL